MSPSLILLILMLFGLNLNARAEMLEEPIKPLPAVPPLNALQVELGRQLFNETRLSANNTLSCASCHQLNKGGADSVAFSIGVLGLPVSVNTPSIFNAALNFRHFWDGRSTTLPAQVHEAVQSPGEMSGNWRDVVRMLGADATYRASFEKAYPDGVTETNVKNALTTYERTLISSNSRFDQYLQGDTGILTQEEKSGHQRFKSSGCIACHQGVNIGGNMLQKFGVMDDYFKARGNVAQVDLGRYQITRDEMDRNVFKVPSLRNVAVTAPYFHDGSAETLEEAVEVMFRYQLGRIPSAEDKTLIIKFLKTLTGEWEGKPL